MKNTLTQITLLALVLLTFTSTTFAGQSAKVYEGYVITNNGEKLEGKIQMLSPSLNEIKVKFISQTNEKKTFKAKEVKEYAFKVEKWNKSTRDYIEEWIFYSRKTVERAPIAFGPTKVLIERQVEGTINLYNHFIEQNATPEQPFVQVIYLEKNNNELVNITKNNYKTVLKGMTTDYPALQAKIGTRGNGFKHIAQMVSEYNEAMTGKGAFSMN